MMIMKNINFLYIRGGSGGGRARGRPLIGPKLVQIEASGFFFGFFFWFYGFMLA